MSSSCTEAFRRFVEEALGRLSFDEVVKRFREGLSENPVFSEVEESGVLGKNIIIILGGRGCGKTLLLRYLKYKLESDDWAFNYINGTDFVKLEKQQAEKVLQNIISEEDHKLSGGTSTKLAVAIDDVAEAVEIAADFLKKQIELAKKYEGRFKLILATQSERGGTLILLRKTLPEASFAEMFFGEHPEESLVESFKTSYIDRRTVTQFRGAALINLDAYWSSMRDLGRVEKLAEAIVEIAEFYAKNAPIQCPDALKRVSEVKNGLALIALATMPKIIDDQDVRAIIEYGRKEDGALNGLGIAELLTRLFADPNIRDIASQAERAYSLLKDVKTSISTDMVENALLKIATETDYMTALENIPVKSIVPIQLQPGTATTKPGQQAGKPSRKYGPRVNAVEVKLVRSGREITRYIILASLKTDRRGYIVTNSIDKIRELVELKVPSKAEERYLVVITPTRESITAVYRALGPEHAKRRGVDVLPVSIDKLSDLEKVFILQTINEALPVKFQSIAPKILAGTLLLSLRGDREIPHLAYLMLPYVA
jgi:hypothetical protein